MTTHIIAVYQDPKEREKFKRDLADRGSAKHGPERSTLVEKRIGWFTSKEVTEIRFVKITYHKDVYQVAGLRVHNVIFLDGEYSAETIRRLLSCVRR